MSLPPPGNSLSPATPGLVSIVIPVHDRLEELPETLASLAAQTHEAWEAVLVDDRSKENVAAVVNTFGDDRVRLHKLPEGEAGAPAARNHGTALARGSYVIFLDSDDLLAPHCLGRRVAYLDTHQELDFAVWKARVFLKEFDDTPLLWNTWPDDHDDPAEDVERFQSGDVVWSTAGPMWRREALRVLGPWAPDLLSGQDRELHFRAAVLAEAGRLRYEKQPEIDHAWRRGSGTRPSIGTTAALSKEHARNRAVLVRRFAQTLQEAGVETPRRREMLLGQALLASRMVAERISRREARQLWHELSAVAGVGFDVFVRGWRLLAMRDELRRDAYARRLIAKWPATMFPSKGRTFLAARVPDAPPPRVSFLMPVRDAAAFLQETVAGVNWQTMPDLELVAVDDGSRDDSLALLHPLAGDDGRIPVARQARSGLAAALNRGLPVCRGEFVARVDADDICEADRILRQVAFLERHPDVVAVGCAMRFIDPSGADEGTIEPATDHETIDADLLAGQADALPHATLMVRRDALQKVGGWNEADFPDIKTDLDLLLRLAEVGPLANLPEPLVRKRRHLDSLTRQRFLDAAAQAERAVRQAHGRRSTMMPADWSWQSETPPPGQDRLLAWGQRALQERRRFWARHFALAGVRRAPSRRDQWSLLRRAFTTR